MSVQKHYLPNYSLWQKFTKKSYVRLKSIYNKIFEIPIAVRDVESMHPNVQRFTAENVAKILFKQTLRDDFAHSKTEMLKRVDQNPYRVNVTAYYNPKTRLAYKYVMGTDRMHVLPASDIEAKMWGDADYLAFTQKVARRLNHKYSISNRNLSSQVRQSA